MLTTSTQPRFTEVTCATARGERTEDIVTNRKTPHIATNLHYFADKLVSRNRICGHRFATVVLVQIGTTDAAAIHTNNHIGGDHNLWIGKV